MADQYFSIGRFVAAFGLKGELILRHSLGKGLRTLEVVFLENRKDGFLPYFVEEIRVKGTGEVYMKLEGVDTPEQARLLNQKEVWLREADFSRMAARSAPVSLLGFHLIDGETDLGEVVEVIEQPMQVLCKLFIRGKEVLIPLHKGTMGKLDKDHKRLYVTLPEGLLDVYLGET
ncbi:ribosome maturation factor RimM [Dinghuibacter silviterrae]|uniref:Ribosome maturation factor RimM n=1 Tax=Dinghuibacter silviterrae TaxID=1539049 RepID=A0A4R8DMU6_9BACT|nr:16S rRNA processing protein RimM [Dinghuibacter silviterrae]TDW99313.1 16S rRNA processing protein RimM [Dinghuibacter silviterrae]